MNKRLILIHGRGFKPNQKDLKKLWLDALLSGLSRDFGIDDNQFQSCNPELVYYGDLSNKLLFSLRRTYDEIEDIDARRKTLTKLKAYSTSDFNESTYQSNSSSFRALGELLADALSGPANLLGVADNLITGVAPDMAYYWNEDTEYGSSVRHRLTGPLAEALEENQDIMIIAHSLGSVVAYDVLWKFSHYGEYRHLRESRLHQFVTLGSPLGNKTVQTRLKGGSLRSQRRFPTNIGRWTNFAAEDDYICHDQTVADDFRGASTNSIHDLRIYNLSIRDGKANQHHGVGYLIHPELSRVVHDWMTSKS